ncbi:MAG: hypothetical protein OEV85_10535 [Candidatus Thorarchaeota archaeon]|nr:hypothetical protein [Candidatus Thorarchaeota archaeon]
MSIQIPRTRLIFKVLVIGRDLALQTGFLIQVSGRNISTQLFNTLGISLGIARFDGGEDCSVTLQLWAIPQNERVSGLSQSFTKGHQAIFVIVRPNEVREVPELITNLSLRFSSNVVIGVVGSYDEAVQACEDFGAHYREGYKILQASETSDVISLLAHKITSKNKRKIQSSTFIILDESICPTYVHPIYRLSEIECTDEEISDIRTILLDQGLQLAGDTCRIQIKEGKASISLKTGAVSMEPDICNFCIHQCKRQANVCIIAVDSGWSSQGISQKALLIAAKVMAIAERRLPQHVESQILRASICAKFELSLELERKGIPADLLAAYSRKSIPVRSLLEVAEKRVKDGKLPRGAYQILKSRLVTVERSISD